MARYKTKKEQRLRRHRRIRQTISGTAAKPRLAVCVTSKHIYVQFIDDENGRTLCAASTLDPKFRETGEKVNTAGAVKLGEIAAEKAKSADITTSVFDRGGFRYHGKVKALADAVRKAGIKI
ncbi:MAG: 50S ribosomal protein L18 [Kiritimatiellaeota bacterium]|nr:50S ribosomal protein L18 [Kiritimatiellota bacterium]